jgi:phosphoribosylcarboxyaminoimidazole (NCAIR) mutase
MKVFSLISSIILPYNPPSTTLHILFSKNAAIAISDLSPKIQILSPPI